MRISKTVLIRVILALVMLALLLPATAVAQGSPQRVIVTFAEGQGVRTTGAIVALGATVEANLPLVDSVAMTLPPGLSMAKVRQVPGVVKVEVDAVVKALGPIVTQLAQTLPWGVDRVDADLVWYASPTYTGVATKVAVIDTGIDIKHPDLVVRGGVSYVRGTKSYTDDNGHGTHVAGIIAATDNTIGVIGAAPAAYLYAVKVLNRSGSGYTSDIIKGITWAINNKMNVINMSLGSSTYVSTFDSACQKAITAGITIVAAAGNSGPGDNTVIYPAKFPNVIGVSATDSNNVITSWSSRGLGVDIAAPGASIYSTYKGQTYATLSGTSMASPHVAGVVALLMSRSVISGYDTNGNVKWDPAEVEKRLTDTATDLGAVGPDTVYGAGLVDAYEALFGS